MASFRTYGRIDGAIVIIGFGSIGRATLPLIERHFEYDANQVVVIEPELTALAYLRQRGLRHVQAKVTKQNYRSLLGGLLTVNKGFCVNLSVDTGSLDIMKLCRQMGVLYIDTVVEPWAGFYFNNDQNADRSNYGAPLKIACTMALMYYWAPRFLTIFAGR